MFGEPEVGIEQGTVVRNLIEATQMCKVSMKPELTVLLATKLSLNIIHKPFSWQGHPDPAINFLACWKVEVVHLESLNLGIRTVRLDISELEPIIGH